MLKHFHFWLVQSQFELWSDWFPQFAIKNGSYILLNDANVFAEAQTKLRQNALNPSKPTHVLSALANKKCVSIKKNGIEGATKAQRQHPWQKYPWKKFREPNYVEKTINVWPSSKELKKNLISISWVGRNWQREGQTGTPALVDSLLLSESGRCKRERVGAGFPCRHLGRTLELGASSLPQHFDLKKMGALRVWV